MPRSNPLIAITNDSDHFQVPAPSRRSLVCPVVYAQVTAAAGGVPVLTTEQCPEELAERMDGLLLSGGGDLAPEYFGEKARFTNLRIDEARDAFEIPLARAFLERGKPVFGICRGIQLLNVVLGGTLYQDLPGEKGVVHSGERLFHEIAAQRDSVLCRLFGERILVNSLHHQAVRVPGNGLIVTATSADGVVEAFEHESLPVLGCQFHPERISCLTVERNTPDFLPLFQHFVALCRDRA
jgi:putative glutamine amidotransferase